MAKPTVSEVLQLSRSLLGDTDNYAGDVYTDAELLPHLKSGRRRLFRVMGAISNPFVTAEAFYDLPDDTRVLDPATAGMNNVGEIISVESRGVTSSVSVSSVSISSGVATVTTSAAHGYSAGYTVVLFNLGGIDGINTMWTLSAAPSTTEAELGGSNLSGTYTSGGTMSYSTEQFTDLDRKMRLDKVTTSQSNTEPLAEWAWMGDKLYFHPSTEARQLRIIYTKTGDSLELTDTIAVDDSLDFLAYYAAGSCAHGKGDAKGRALLVDAIGPGLGQDENFGGLLRELLAQGVKAMPDVGSQPWGVPLHSIDELR